MSDDYQDRPRRPMRETVCDIDRDILKLVMRRHNLIQRMSAPRGRLAPQEERYLRESWESLVARVSTDPKLSSRFFTLLQEVEFLPRPEEGAQARRPSFGLAPAMQPVRVNLEAHQDQEQTQLWIMLAAASGQAMTLRKALMNDAEVDCARMFSQLGASINRSSESIASTAGVPCQAPDKVLHVGDSELNFYLGVAHYIGRPSHAKFTGGAALKMANFTAVRHFLPALGGRLITLVPHSEGLPVRIESAGLVPELVRLPADLPEQFVISLLVAASCYGKLTRFELADIDEKRQSDILARALPMLEKAGADFVQEGSMVSLRGTGVKLPAVPCLDMDTSLAAVLLGFAAVNGGVVRLAGTWPGTARAAALETFFEETGLKFEKGESEVVLRVRDDWKLPNGRLNVPASLPADLVPLPLALACVQALVYNGSMVPAGIPDVVPDQDIHSFAGACGLIINEDAIEPRNDNERSNLTWTAPSPIWACALALAACRRPHPGRGFQLNNPGVLTDLYPGFWALYNSLPEPVERKPEAPAPVRPARRRVLTTKKACLTPPSGEDA